MCVTLLLSLFLRRTRLRLPCKTKWGVDEAGKRARLSKATGTVIPKPPWENENLPARADYEEQAWDTTAAALSEVTYTPSALSFEEEVMQACLQAQAQANRG